MSSDPLGSHPTSPNRELVVIDSPAPQRDFEVCCRSDELTCVCPVTGQPDFATVTITYVPDAHIVELKSLKQYLWSFRAEAQFHEALTNRILDDLVAALRPRSMSVVTDWNVRGGIHTTVTVTHPPPPGAS